MSNKNKGILLILISSLFGAITLTLIKLGGNIPVYEKSFLRNVCTILIAFYALKKAKELPFG
ncbi:MAG: EamA family transporter, partial [Clostridium sp.]